MAPHFRQTARRAAKHGRVLVIHDTTQFEFPGNSKREGLGRLIHPGQGFFGHFSLVATADGERVPLGLAALETVFRLEKAIGHKNWTPSQSRGERARWLNCVDDAETLLGDETSAIHVMDREADSYAIFAALIEERQRSFVVRSFQDRVLGADHDEARLRAAARSARAIFRREVPLSPRPAKPGPQGKRHPARRLRVARLSFAATSVELPRPSDSRAVSTASIPLNVIHVFEPKPPPPGQPAVEWFLLTNLPVDTPEEIAFVVDCYRGRWTIEEFFKALKTGCQYERRQLESATSLLNALAILAPVAWRLLLLRHLARGDDKSQAISALTPKQLEVPASCLATSLPRRPSAKQAMLAVASSAVTSNRTATPAGSSSAAAFTTSSCSSSAGEPERRRREVINRESRRVVPKPGHRAAAIYPVAISCHPLIDGFRVDQGVIAKRKDAGIWKTSRPGNHAIVVDG